MVGGRNSGLRRVCVCILARVCAVVTTMGCSRVQERRDKGKIKMRWFLALNRGNVATCGCNVATFQRVKNFTEEG